MAAEPRRSRAARRRTNLPPDTLSPRDDAAAWPPPTIETIPAGHEHGFLPLRYVDHNLSIRKYERRHEPQQKGDIFPISRWLPSIGRGAGSSHAHSILAFLTLFCLFSPVASFRLPSRDGLVPPSTTYAKLSRFCTIIYHHCFTRVLGSGVWSHFTSFLYGCLSIVFQYRWLS
jgi:hypothetical protein